MMKAVTLKRGRDKSILRRHPWVFSGAIAKADEGIVEGDLIVVKSAEGSVLAVGHFSNASLSVKVLEFSDTEISSEWFEQKIKAAASMRAGLKLISADTNAYRLVHAEGDGLPGLIIDIYNDVAVVQPHTAGMERSEEEVTNALKALGFTKIVWRSKKAKEARVILGEVTERTSILESGITYHVDVLRGQKTGFFLDQRNSRARLQDYAKGASVLNVFSYTGGFSMAALSAGATNAVSLDSSAQALDLADENARINGFEKSHQIVKNDAIPYLSGMSEEYDVIVLDPPAFAKHKSARHQALQAYRRINEAAMMRIKNGGYLFTFSCSQVIDRQLFQDVVMSAAINANKGVQVLEQLHQPQDHPVSIFHPEGEYLKGLILRISD